MKKLTLLFSFILLALFGASIPVAAQQQALLQSAAALQSQPPLTIGQPLVWVDAADAATITKDGSDRVALWLDKGGMRNHMVQNTTNNKPIYISTTALGKPSIRFTSTGNTSTAQRMTGSVAPTPSYDTTFFALIKKNTRVSSSEPILSFMGTVSYGSTSSPSTEIMDWSVTGSTDGQSAIRTAPAPIFNEWVIVSGRRSATFNNIELRENGAVLKTTNFTGGLVASAASAIRIGWDNNGNYANAEYAEVIVYPQWLSDKQMLFIEDYLNNKWKVYTNFAGRRDLHRGVQRYATANHITSLAGLPDPKPMYGMFGQSNAAGVGYSTSLTTTLQGPISNSLIWDGSAWSTLQVGVNNQPNLAGRHGTEIPLAHDIATSFGGIYLVKYAVGGTDLATRWRPDSPSGQNLYKVFIARIDAARYALGMSSGQELVPKMFVWYQGEDDTNATYAPAYQDNEQYLFSTLRNGTDVPKAQTAQICSVFINNTSYTSYYGQVNNAKISNSAIIASYTTAPGWTDSVDSVHAATGSLLTTGDACAAAAGASATAPR